MASESFPFYTTKNGADHGEEDERAMIGHFQKEKISWKVRTGMSCMLPDAR